VGFGGHTFRTTSRRREKQKVGAFRRARSSQVFIDSAYDVADVVDAGDEMCKCYVADADVADVAMLMLSCKGKKCTGIRKTNSKLEHRGETPSSRH
jgi:hypothetical protein